MTTPEPLAIDTSVAIPLLVADHEAHDWVSSWAGDRPLLLAGHATVETYSVLTRLPGHARLSAQDAVTLIDDRLACLALTATPTEVYRALGNAGITGGAVYDGVVALTAREHRLALGTRDARARGTYQALGVAVELLTPPH